MIIPFLYTCRNEMMGTPVAAPTPQIAAYSEAVPVGEPLARYGDSDFLRAVEGLDPEAAWAVMNEHMNTIRVVNPRAYDGVMRKLKAL